jgi:hypothetical protein
MKERNMNTKDKNNFNWGNLLDQINMQNVIPVIGQGLYWVNTGEKNKEVLLYKYLTEELAGEIKVSLPEKTKYGFSQMVFRYLHERPDDYKGLRDFLTQKLSPLYPIKDSPLLKLTRIKPFTIFLNTTYDHFLEQTLRSVRNYPNEVLHHCYKQKRTDRVTIDLIKSIEEYKTSLLFHIYGSITKTMIPAYTENEMLETVVRFLRDMEKQREKILFQELKEKSLLFIGCQYEDWLFRFFARLLSDQPYSYSNKMPAIKFVSDDFETSHSRELVCFLKAYGAEVFYPGDSRRFIDNLFTKMEEHNSENIIMEDDFPETVFVSFNGENRLAARKLVCHLCKDGVNVWMDEKKLKPGDHVDKTIIKAIKKCPAFVLIISKVAKQIQKNDILKYHIREWEIAYSRKITGKNPLSIIAVNIDGTDWKYEKFKDGVFVNIPGGNKEGDYEKLRKLLLEIQNKKRLL